MTKLELLIDASLDRDNAGCLNHLTKIFKEVNENDWVVFYYILRIYLKSMRIIVMRMKNKSNLDIHQHSASYRENSTKIATNTD